MDRSKSDRGSSPYLSDTGSVSTKKDVKSADNRPRLTPGPDLWVSAHREKLVHQAITIVGIDHYNNKRASDQIAAHEASSVSNVAIKNFVNKMANSMVDAITYAASISKPETFQSDDLPETFGSNAFYYANKSFDIGQLYARRIGLKDQL